MSGYPHNNQPGYGYGGSPGQPYGAPQQPGAPYSPYGAQPPYGAPSAPHKPDKPPKDAYSQPPYYGSGSAPEKPPKDAYSQPPYYGGSVPEKPPKDGYSQPPYYGGSAPGKPDKPPKDDFSHSHYGGSAPPMAQPYGAAPPMAQPYGAAPPMAEPYGVPPPQPYGSPFAALVPSAFPPGTDPSVVACFQVADQDGSGLIDDKELQRALSSYNQSFSLRTVHLLMYLFTNTNSRKIGPKEFTSLFYSLQNWRVIFERHDRDRSGQIDPPELREALLSLGYAVSPTVLDLLVLKFDKSGGKNRAIEYDNFIECCLTVKGLADKFKAKDTNYTGSATFTYEEFMLTVLPFLVA